MLVGWSVGWSIGPLVGPSVRLSPFHFKNWLLQKLITSQLLRTCGLVTTLFLKVIRNCTGNSLNQTQKR
jgi:hypothetical protein